MKHIDFAQLVERFEGILAEADTARVDEHMAVCGECAAAGSKLSDIFAYAAPTDLEPVPQATTARILNIWQRRPDREKSVVAKRTLASLIFDDWQIALNERYSGIDTRQMLYRFGEYEIDLRIDLAGNTARISGQLFPEISDASASLRSAGVSMTAPVNEFGEFVFEAAAFGIYELRISGSAVDIEIENIPVQR